MKAYTHINTDIVTVTLFRHGIRASDISWLFLFPAEIDGRSHLEPECISNISWVTTYDQILLLYSHFYFLLWGEYLYTIYKKKLKYAVTNQSDAEREKNKKQVGNSPPVKTFVFECGSFVLPCKYHKDEAVPHMWAHASPTTSEWVIRAWNVLIAFWVHSYLYLELSPCD